MIFKTCFHKYFWERTHFVGKKHKNNNVFEHSKNVFAKKMINNINDKYFCFQKQISKKGTLETNIKNNNNTD